MRFCLSKLTAKAAVKDLEAIVIALIAPRGNLRQETFGEAKKWTHVIKP